MWGEDQANYYLRGLDETINHLAENSNVGVKIEHIRKNYRQYHFRRHIILYCQTSLTLTIVRVLHERMDVNRHKI